MTRNYLILVAALLIALTVLAAPVSADGNSTVSVQSQEEDNGGNTTADTSQSLVEEVENLKGSLDDIIVQAGLNLLVKPFQLLSQVLSDMFTEVIVSYPDVKHSDVLDIHLLVFQLSLLLAVPVFMWIGFQHMTGRADGIRPTVELVVVLGFGGVSPWLLHYPVQLSELVTRALRPENASIVGSLSVSLTTAVIIWFQALLLLALVILFIVQSFYLAWYVAAAPLIFLLTYFKPTRKFASPLSGLFIGFLLLPALEMIAFQLVLAMLDMQGGSALTQYIWGIGGYFVLLALPYQILSASSSLITPAVLFARTAAGKAGDRVKPAVRERFQNLKQYGHRRTSRAKNRFLQDKPQKVNVEHRSKNEVELNNETSRTRRAANTVRNRFRTDKADVSVEDEFREDENGDWQHKTELKEDNRGD